MGRPGGPLTPVADRSSQSGLESETARTASANKIDVDRRPGAIRWIANLVGRAEAAAGESTTMTLKQIAIRYGLILGGALT